ncbi:phospholipase D-like domain-containing protein [Sulfurimonas sp.]|uniref:phospholipase D-like domain-containing protein n=1 Tax=Sulfurimonas sp. TaxID=2022749 RepID=UPI002AB1AB08|nr:phospholipase D-like domain-containing protein [Sulfurimonas sp.]
MQNSFLNFLVLHGVFIIGELLILFTMLHMLYQRRTPTSMISWLLFIIVVPYFSVLLYFLIGVRKQSTKNGMSSLSLKSSENISNIEVNVMDGILRFNGIPGASQHNSFELITQANVAYTNMMDEIKKTKKSISMSTYVFKNDVLTQEIIKELTIKAKEGVRVRLLIDSLGSYKIYFFQNIFKELRQAGGKVSFFMPLLRLPYRNYINLRNHRKIYLFDEETLLSGGMNLSCEYMGANKTKDQWEDILFKTQGEATYQYSQVFEDDWAYANHSPIRKATIPNKKNYGDASIQVVPSGPDIKGDALYKSLLSAIYSAKQRVWIVTPYFIPDENLMYALKIAKHKGVDVKLITPKKSNQFFADLARTSYMRELDEANINLVLYNGNMLHAKVILFDDAASMIGSVNIDNRSLLLNYEIVSFIYDKDTLSKVDVWMQNLMNNSQKQIAKASKSRRIFENFMRIIAPQL